MVGRFLTVVDKLLIKLKLGVMERQVARGFLTMFAKSASDEDVVNVITLFEGELMPYILRGEMPDAQ